MQKLLAVVVSAIFVTLSLTQNPEEPKDLERSGGPVIESPCDKVKNFIADSFNTISFTTSTSYHDSINFRTLFVGNGTDDWSLYDFKEGKGYIFDSGICSFYYSADAQLIPQLFASKLEINWYLPNIDGSRGVGYTAKNGVVTLRGVLTSECVEIFTYITVNGIPYSESFHTNIRTEDVDDTISEKIKDARAIISEGGCTQIGF